MKNKDIRSNLKLLQTNLSEKDFYKEIIGYKYFTELKHLDEIIQEVNEMLISKKDGRFIYLYLTEQIVKSILKGKTRHNHIQKDDQKIIIMYNEDSDPLELIGLLKKYGY